MTGTHNNNNKKTYLKRGECENWDEQDRSLNSPPTQRQKQMAFVACCQVKQATKETSLKTVNLDHLDSNQ